MKKRRLAIIGVGMVGIPVLMEILIGMSAHFQITIYSFIPIDKFKVPLGIRIRCMPRVPVHQRLKYFLVGIWFSIDHARSSFEVIHAQSAFPGGVMARFLGKLYRIPWMVTLIGGEVEAMPEVPFGDLLNHRLKNITYRVCSEAKVLTVMSEFQASSVRNNLNLKRKIEILPYAPPVKRLQEKEIVFPVKLLHVAYHHPVKNHEMLLLVLSRLVKQVACNLTIVGANYGQAFLKRMEELKLQDHIKMCGPKPYDEMERFYHESHILIHTSWYEGLPTVAFEAMANGSVVCGTHVGIMADLSRTHCLTVLPGRDEDLSEIILGLIYNSERYKQLRKNAHGWAKDHDLNNYIDQMTHLYDEIICAKM